MLTMAAAAVTAGVLVATHLGSINTVPVTAGTSTIMPSASLMATSAGTASPTASATAGPTETPTALAAVGHGECTKENVVGTAVFLSELLPKLEVAGCSGEWMALSQTVAGMPDSSSFLMARLRGGEFIVDTSQPYAQVAGWGTASQNNERLSAVQYMDKEFTTKGIPVELRKSLVGEPAPDSLAALGIKTYEDRSTGYKVSFNYPASWQIGDPSGSLSLTGGPGTALTNSSGQSMAQLALGETNDWSTSGCLNKAPYKILDSQPMPGLPVDPSSAAQGTPRFVYVAMTSAANDGGPVQAGIGITNRIAGQDGIGCVLDLAVAGPGALKFFSFTDRRPLGGPTWGLYKFNTMEEAAAFTQTQGYKDLKTVITSLTITKVD
ncbi:hypothetical protein AB4Z38_19150 [Arthrobacter sp. 2RAF6]|uniref:hypothetical protein n=1 Tax=Arthrobacter sp. 2RAF6 TaxID=3233002 RepID=UPI003F903B26